MTSADLPTEGARWIDSMTDKPALVVYHRDTDGLCSALLMSAILKRSKGISAALMPCDEETVEITTDMLKGIINRAPFYVIFVDMAVDQNPSRVILLKEKIPCSIMVLDHHPPESNLNPLGVLHLNPRFADRNSYVPASCLAYRIGKKLVGMGDVAWLAAVGVVGDHGADNCMDVVVDFVDTHPGYGASQKALQESAVGMVSNMIMSARAMGHDGIEKALKIIEGCKSMEDVFSSPDMLEWQRKVQAEVDAAVNGFEKKAETFRDANAAFYGIETGFRIESVVASILSEKYPRMTVVVYGRYDSRIKCSIRSQKGEDVAVLVKRALTGLGNSSGGGHPQAAGATIFAVEWERFKASFIKTASGR